ncbi:MAG: LysM peptidoglycan-binding domain-containing protein, partial [Aggregatilineales bacterium]
MTGDYDFRYGETDLQETALGRSARTYLLLTTFILLIVGGGGLVAFVGTSLLTPPTPTPQMLATSLPAAPGILATVTIGPPTATLSLTPSMTFTPSVTPTREPCVQTVQTGDSLSGVVARCGHFSRDVLDEVVDDNNLPNANSIVVGQQLIIPWPTLTPDPNALPTATPIVSANLSLNVENSNVLEVNEDLDAFAPTTTPTLPPGVMWHEIAAQENLSVIIIEYDANVKTLSELNPEMDFSSCE